jgi:hypothetical protein
LCRPPSEGTAGWKPMGNAVVTRSGQAGADPSLPIASDKFSFPPLYYAVHFDPESVPLFPYHRRHHCPPSHPFSRRRRCCWRPVLRRRTGRSLRWACRGGSVRRRRRRWRWWPVRPCPSRTATCHRAARSGCAWPSPPLLLSRVSSLVWLAAGAGGGQPSRPRRAGHARDRAAHGPVRRHGCPALGRVAPQPALGPVRAAAVSECRVCSTDAVEAGC